jgi:thiol-disulfide isomerase/thioredoxin
LSALSADPAGPGRPSVIFYTARWCSVCAGVAPIVEVVAQRHPGVALVAVDVDTPGVDLGTVKGVPTMVAVSSDGTTTGRRTGAATEDQIEALFAAAADGTDIIGTMDPTTRLIRIGAGVALGVGGLASAAPLVGALGLGSLIWGTYDLVTAGTRRQP